jgi:hypothetical protein
MLLRLLYKFIGASVAEIGTNLQQRSEEVLTCSWGHFRTFVECARVDDPTGRIV